MFIILCCTISTVAYCGCVSGEKPEKKFISQVKALTEYTVAIVVKFPDVFCSDAKYTLTYKYAHHHERARMNVLWDTSKNSDELHPFPYWMHIEFNGTMTCNKISKYVSAVVFTGKGSKEII